MRSTDAPSGLTYHHNGDYSGAVRVEIPMGRRAGTSYGVSSVDYNEQTTTVDIPFEDMRHLVLASIRKRMIMHLEEADDATLEKFLFTAPLDAAPPKDSGACTHPSWDQVPFTLEGDVRALARRCASCGEPLPSVLAAEPEMCGKNTNPGSVHGMPCALPEGHDGDEPCAGP